MQGIAINFPLKSLSRYKTDGFLRKIVHPARLMQLHSELLDIVDETVDL